MSRKPETPIVQSIIEAVILSGGFAIHTPGSVRQANQPDIDGSIPDGLGGWIFFKVEAKIPGEKARKAQDGMMSVWSSVGYLTGTVHSLDEFTDLILAERRRRHALLPAEEQAAHIQKNCL